MSMVTKETTMENLARRRWPWDQGSHWIRNYAPLNMPDGPEAAWRRTAEMVDAAHGAGAFSRYVQRASREHAHDMDRHNVHRLMHCRAEDPQGEHCMSPLCARCGGHGGLAHANTYKWALYQSYEDEMPVGAEMVELSMALPERFSLVTTIRYGINSIHRVAVRAASSALRGNWYSCFITLVQPVVTEAGMEHRVRVFTVFPLGVRPFMSPIAADVFASEMRGRLGKIAKFRGKWPEDVWLPAEASLVRGRDQVSAALYEGMAPPNRDVLWDHLFRSAKTIWPSLGAFDYRAMVVLYSDAGKISKTARGRVFISKQYDPCSELYLLDTPKV
jgi:hypothetical protein